MNFSQFHFAQTAWLWGLAAIPVVILLYALFRRPPGAQLLDRFADRHLLPHLVKTDAGAGQRNIRWPLLFWSLAWICGVLAMAGPRWNYTEVPTFHEARDLVIVLDLSRSMNATDVKPSRIARARQEIEDLLNMSRGTSIGLVAYAAVPHMVTPLTDDVQALRNLLPAVDTSLITIQGDRLKPALEMAVAMLKAEPGSTKSILVIGDGGFEETDFAVLAHAAGDATILTMGVGSASAPEAPLRADRLQSLAAAGKGFYVEAEYTDSDTRAILSRVEGDGDKTSATLKSARIWADEFYIPALLLALLMLPWFRRGAAFPAILLATMLFNPAAHAAAPTAEDLFLNRQQKARAAYEHGDYKRALKEFDTPYRRGVAAYRARDYALAAHLFKIAAGQKGGLDALYDLGNAQLMQGQVENAVASYEAVLKRKPGDVGAHHNLAIALKLLEQDKQKQKKQPKGGGSQDKEDKKKADQQKGKSSPTDKQRAAQKSPARKAEPAKSDPSGKQQQAQRAKTQNAEPPVPRTAPSPPPQSGAIGGAPGRPRRDVDADEWLGRIESDPGSFLRNQFAIEEHKSGSGQP